MNKSLKRATLVSSLLCIGVIGYSTYGIDTFFADKVSKAHQDWLSKVDDNTKLSDLYLPGTHNSGARFSSMDASGKCQDISIKSQLTLGVRYLDIRLINDVSGLRIVHSYIDQKTTFQSTLKTCYEFLEENPSEFILMSIKNDGKGNSKLSFEERLKREINNKYFYHSDSLPDTIKDIRGKIVQLSRYADSTIGINCHSGWKDSDDDITNTFVLEEHYIKVQDYYRVTDIEYKKGEILKCAESTGYDLTLNFTSGFFAESFPPNNAFDVAERINDWLYNDVLTSDKIKPQVFVADFITDTLAYSMIYLNFESEGK